MKHTVLRAVDGTQGFLPARQALPTEPHHPTQLILLKIYILKCRSVLLACVFVDHMWAWCPPRSEEVLARPGVELWLAVGYLLGAGNPTQFFPFFLFFFGLLSQGFSVIYRWKWGDQPEDPIHVRADAVLDPDLSATQSAKGKGK